MDVNAKPKNSRTLLLLDPYPRDNPYQMTASERRSIWFPKLSLPVIAAYTPPGWDVRLVMKNANILAQSSLLVSVKDFDLV